METSYVKRLKRLLKNDNINDDFFNELLLMCERFAMWCAMENELMGQFGPDAEDEEMDAAVDKLEEKYAELAGLIPKSKVKVPEGTSEN